MGNACAANPGEGTRESYMDESEAEDDDEENDPIAADIARIKAERNEAMQRSLTGQSPMVRNSHSNSPGLKEYIQAGRRSQVDYALTCH